MLPLLYEQRHFLYKLLNANELRVHTELQLTCFAGHIFSSISNNNLTPPFKSSLAFIVASFVSATHAEA